MLHVVIITSSAQALFGLRKELVESWVKDGHKVTAIGELNEEEFGPICNNYGFNYKQVPLERNGLNPFKDYRTLTAMTTLLKQLKPDRVFCTFAKSVAYGAWAARRAGIKETYALISGLGSGFRGNTAKEKIIAKVMGALYKNAFQGCKKVVFQNNDDVNELVTKRLLDRTKVEIVNGSGVDLERFEKTSLPRTSTILFVGRLLKEKGIREFIKAAAMVKNIHPEASFMVVGDIDSNPSSLSKEEVNEIQSIGLIDFYGFQSDVRPFIRKADIFVLPSYHEGTPRCVLEAMSMGRPILTTDAPGCRETVVDGINGYKVPVGDSSELSDKIIYLLENPAISENMGEESRRIAESKYDINIILSDYKKIMNLN